MATIHNADGEVGSFGMASSLEDDQSVNSSMHTSEESLSLAIDEQTSPLVAYLTAILLGETSRIDTSLFIGYPTLLTIYRREVVDVELSSSGQKVSTPVRWRKIASCYYEKHMSVAECNTHIYQILTSKRIDGRGRVQMRVRKTTCFIIIKIA